MSDAQEPPPGELAADRLSDDYPVLLGPVRIETRFTATELLVRVFPDEWSTEMFEPRPTAPELAALDAYWTALWRSGGDAVAEGAAWRELTGRMSAGRARWLLRDHRPANPAERPTGVPPETTVLVIVSAQALPANDRAPTITYWTAVWRAHGDRAAIRAADIALTAATGAGRARAIRARRPVGIDAAPAGAGDAVTVAFLVLPQQPAAEVAPSSWTRAARARLLPDRFAFLGYVNGQRVVAVTGEPVPDTLAVSPDPGLPDAEQLAVDEETGALRVPEDLRWLADFGRAVEVGMGVRIPLDDTTRQGLDRLVVLGLRLDPAPEQSGTELADLFTRQLRGPGGFSLLPQGIPTNNTERAPAGRDSGEAAGAGPAAVLGAAALAAAPGDWAARTDGQWFADLLGIDPAALADVAHADGTDQRDARAANVALWPATWGAFLTTALHPVLGDEAVARTREFFVRHVSGRGPIPAVKIGRQPYGILPTTAFSRLAWPDTTTHPDAAHRRGLHAVLTTVGADWLAAAGQVTHLGAPEDPDHPVDPHQALLDILALHPTSAEFHQRYARSVEEIFNRENLGGNGPAVLPALDALGMPQPIRELLARLGHAGPDPDLIRRLFAGAQYPLLAPLVDDRPLSGTDPVRPCAPQGNYLRWLAHYAATDLEPIRLESGFDAGRPPAALLYLLLRHAVLLGWAEAGRRLAAAAGSPVPPAADPPFIHISGEASGSESRYRQLYSPDPAITGRPDTTVAEHIPGVLATSAATAPLAEQVRALDLLADVPTARLERVLIEHLDCATYRFDAWRLGLANERLAELRFGPDGTAPARRGVHLGAYGWLTDIRPRTGQRTPVELSGTLGQIFTPPGSTPLLRAPGNGGFVHAPSPGHATTAAVLRAGYVANATPQRPGTFAVNLSSERVRAALTVLDGLRQGQSLGALLGYQFERGLHDRYAEAEVDSFITALRGVFPLRAGKLAETAPEEPVAIERIEARNVIDGLALVRHVTRTGPAQYPFGYEDRLPEPANGQGAAIDAEVVRLLDLHDALADLAVAEGTHQALQGNTERASATLDAYAADGFPPEPAVVATPRSGVTLTHRLGLQFRPGLGPDHGSGLFQGNGPRAKGEPAVNDWLPTLLPGQNDVAARVTWTDPVSGQARERVVTQRDIRLQPLDLLWTVRPEDQAAMTDLDDRILGHVIDRDHPRPDAVLTIRHTQRIDGKITFFELSPLISALRTLLTTARPLRASDLVPPAGAAPADPAVDETVALPRARPAAVHEALAELRDGVTDYADEVSPLVDDPARRAELISRIDTVLAGYGELVSAAAGFGMVRSGWGEAAEWRRGVFGEVLTAVAATADRMAGSLAATDALLAEYNALPSQTPAETRFGLLQRAEQLLGTAPTSPRPATPQQLRAIVLGRRAAFAGRLQALRQVNRTTRATLSGLLADVSALLPLTAFDRLGLDLAPHHDRIVAFATDLRGRARSLLADIAARLAAAGTALEEYDAAVTGQDRVRAATDALTALLGEDALVVPEFTPPEPLAEEWRRARNDSDELLEHLDRDFPVDDWVHGLARVREKVRCWEKAVTLSDALRGPGGLLSNVLGWQEPLLEPIQLPYRRDDTWLGMEFPASCTVDENKLLYTAHYAVGPPLGGGAHCGLLLDEWTEVLPAATETTGVALHYDGPDSEPPQAMLLVAPPVRTGAWSWDDLVAAVHETFELARVRAVEPAHLDTTAYAHLLPATVMSATRRPITISTDLATANLRWKAHD
ncbi:hypothetical protein [Streptomyces litchfieldiae]|uniref:Uncharacterized protein n=1 Tax=Streptomyces litchfieldiae TaxID=3075543 RepID=A0ABU2N135_9ACTN|nr:hypothetical protein [Streptomyces sp. DSM 44938]MDT0347461.1 hypothetical protein [Streptomyces sp. DSM 44938]